MVITLPRYGLEDNGFKVGQSGEASRKQPDYEQSNEIILLAQANFYRIGMCHEICMKLDSRLAALQYSGPLQTFS